VQPGEVGGRDAVSDCELESAFAYLTRTQRSDGSWLPLWFGNQHALNDENPTYGTARVLAAYRDLNLMNEEPARRGIAWLLSNQNPDGGWGARLGTPSSMEETALAVEIAAAAKAKGVYSVDAPVSGGDVGAKNATLSIMVGGDQEAAEVLMPCFNAMGKTIVFQGPAGAGQHTKMVNQILIATNMIGVCEALLYGYKAGLDLPTVMQSVGPGAAGSWSLSNLGPRIMNNNFDPGFFVEHFIKDMGIALAEARRMNLSLPGLALAHQLYVAVKAQGYGRNGTHALELALARLSGINWKERQHGR